MMLTLSSDQGLSYPPAPYITDVKPLELRVKFGTGLRGRVHVTEANSDNNSGHPFANFKVGQSLTARIVSKAGKSEINGRSSNWDLSLKPMSLDGGTLDKAGNNELNFSIGQFVTGYVSKVDYEWVWITISRHVTAQLFLLDTAVEPEELNDFQKRFNVGKVVSGYILSINKERKLLRLVMRPFNEVSNGTHDGEVLTDASSDTSNKNVAEHMHEGDIICGRILKILPGVGGLLVQVGPHLHGKVHYTEISTSWVSDPLSGFHEGQFVKCKVLEISRSIKGTTQVDLSLRTCVDGISNNGHHMSRIERIEDLYPNMAVQGYVKNTTSKGCFIMLSRKLDAKILLTNLSDGYVKDVEKEYPIGKMVTGRVLSVDPSANRIEVTLKTLGASKTQKSEICDFSGLHVGDIISGKIKRVESFGLFITIDHKNMVGLCHISEVSDDPVDNLDTKYREGDIVTAKILKVNQEKQRISLGMKNSYIRDGGDDQTPDDDQIIASPENRRDSDGDTEEFPLEKAEARASAPTLEVTLDDILLSDEENTVTHDEGHINDAATKNKTERRAKKKAKAEREEEIRMAEERQLEKDIPRTADEFEKLIRTSPDSSLVWIKYMEFMVSLCDIDKARAIAERALRTINMQFEEEKLNVWVAYLNLENKYGNPSEEAVQKIFQRALDYCDPEKIHLRLLEMYERTEQHELTGVLIDKMTKNKKFRQSEEIWLRLVGWILKVKGDGVQSAINRALLSLPRNKHIPFISQVAILEFKCGFPDGGRSHFEGILREYPKRSDLWTTYIDQEIRLGDADIIRALFERATSLSLPPKKIKSLFKKFLLYETAHGDEERVEYVKTKAREYQESTDV